MLDVYESLARTPVSPDPMEITWAELRKVPTGLGVQDGVFLSPHTRLPSDTRLARVRLLEPSRSYHRLVVLFAANNDHGYKSRSRSAVRLARRGIASLILENPFYGTRRLGTGGPTTVLDTMMMGRATVEEGVALISAMARPGLMLAVSGYSMGGGVAAMVGALTEHAVATAAVAPSHSPGPVFTGPVISGAVDWDALEGPDPVARLGRLLGASSTLNYPPPAHARASIFAIGSEDGYIPRPAFDALPRHWPGSERRMLPGGHVSNHYFIGRSVALIEESFGRLENLLSRL